MTEKPFFSIIIPIYNASGYLRDCLQSIADQDFQDWEAILVDDCSTDNSVTIAEDFIRTDSRFTLHKSPENSGGAYAPRMRGANLAKGKYLIFIDADDKISDNLLSSHYQKIFPLNVDLIIPEMWKLKGTVSYKILPLESIDAIKVWIGKDLVIHTLCGWSLPMAGYAVRRGIFLKADSQVSEKDKKSIFADEFLSRWILCMSRRVVLDAARYYYRLNEESVTHTNIPRFIESKLLTCDSLIDMTAEVFGEGSPTHLRALDNKFLSVVDLLRMISDSKLDSHQKAIGIKKVSAAMKNFDLSKLRGRISPRYLAVMRLPIPMARIAFKIIDPLMGIKKRRP